VKASGPGGRNELRLQQQAGWGDFTLQARQPQGQPVVIDGSLASRLWLTTKGLHLGAVGDHNLVIHQLGHPDLRLQLGRQSSRSNAAGQAAFGRTPAWTETQFKVDTQSIPFDLHWRTGQVRIATAARRAYWVDQRPQSERVPEYRLRLPSRLLARIRNLSTPKNRIVAFTPEGHLDLHSLEEVPLGMTLDSGEFYSCTLSEDHLDKDYPRPEAPSDGSVDVPVYWITCPTIKTDQPPSPEEIREALSTPPPSSG
jgi:hypothetical protein